MLFDLKQVKIGEEPTVQEKVIDGIDIISFSGDKLLGGPQAGVIVGKKKFIDRMKQHQLARVLRVDKFTLAGLEATLKAYVRGQGENEIPTIRDLIESSESVLKKATYFIKKVVSEAAVRFHYEIVSDVSKVGGGTMPAVEIDTFVVRLQHEDYTSEQIAAYLRRCEIPIIVRVKREAVMLDFRTVTNEEVEVVIEGFLEMQRAWK